MSLLALIFQGIPEMIALTTFAFVLAKADLNWRIICASGVVMGVIAFVIRLLPVTFGVHTIVLIFLLIIIIHQFAKVEIIKTVVSVFLSFVVLVLLETVTHVTLFSVLEFSMETVMNSEMLMILVGIPQIVLLFLISFVIKKIR